MFRLILLGNAKENLNDIISYISQDNPYYANLLIESIEKTFNIIKKFPYIGREIINGKR